MVLAVQGLSKAYDGHVVLDAVSFTVARGETVCLLGPSGSGKSTLLRLIAGLETPDSGRILWEGHDLAEVPVHERGFGLMFQDYALFPHMTVWENVAFGLRMQHLPRAEIQRRVQDALARVNMTQFAHRRVTDLSGGEQQRVALARTLAPRPRLLMLDEPLGSLDRALREHLLEDLRRILREEDTPAIYVTHDQEEAFAIADRVILLHEGRLVQMGRPEEVYARPASTWVAQFLGLTNLLPGQIVSHTPLRVATQEGTFVLREEVLLPREATSVTLLIRPGAARLAGAEHPGENILLGRVVDVVFAGDMYRVEIVTSRGRTFRFVCDTAPRVGENVAWYLRPDRIGIIPREASPPQPTGASTS